MPKPRKNLKRHKCSVCAGKYYEEYMTPLELQSRYGHRLWVCCKKNCQEKGKKLYSAWYNRCPLSG